MYDNNYAPADDGSFAVADLIDGALERLHQATTPDRPRITNKLIVDVLNNEFKHIDANQDGILSKSELTTYSQLQGLSAGSKTVTQHAARNVEEFAELASTKDSREALGSVHSQGRAIYDEFLKDDRQGLTRKDISVLKNLQPNSDLAKAFKNLRSSESFDWPATAIYGLATLASATGAILSPEPTSKYWLGAKAIAFGGLTGFAINRGIHKASPALIQQFEQRQKMIESWK